MRFGYILFGLNNVLIDRPQLLPCWGKHTGMYMAEQYGGNATAWETAYTKIVADWDSYFADLNLSGDDGIHDLWEGMFRINRAMFRLTDTPEPPLDEIWRITREIPAIMPAYCDAAYPEVSEVLAHLTDSGYILSVASYSLSAQTRAILEGSHILQYIDGIILGIDNAEWCVKDAAFYHLFAQMAGYKPAQCIIIDSNLSDLRAAKSIGMKTIQIRREPSTRSSPDADMVMKSLAWLPDYLAQINKKG